MSETTEAQEAARAVLLSGDPRDAAKEWLKLLKTCLLDTGASLPVLYFDTPNGAVMMPCTDGGDLRDIASRAATMAAELGATRILGNGTAWLVDAKLLAAPPDKPTTKKLLRSRTPAALAFCADREHGAAVEIAQIVPDKKGRPRGFREPAPNLTMGTVPTRLTVHTAVGFIADPKERATAMARVERSWSDANRPALAAPEARARIAAR